jgi:hypothetical protein
VPLLEASKFTKPDSLVDKFAVINTVVPTTWGDVKFVWTLMVFPVGPATEYGNAALFGDTLYIASPEYTASISIVPPGIAVVTHVDTEDDTG